MGQLYYAQTQLYSTVLGVKFSGQVRTKHRDPQLTSRSSSFRLFSQILYQGPNQLIYTCGWRGSYARRRCTASLRSVVHHVRARSRTRRISRRSRTTSRPDTRTLWWGVRGGAGSWVPICLGDHVWVCSPLATRLGCPESC